MFFENINQQSPRQQKRDEKAHRADGRNAQHFWRHIRSTQHTRTDQQRTIDDAEDYPSIYNIPKDELQKYKDEVIALEDREDEIREELKKTRASIRRYWVRLFDDI